MITEDYVSFETAKLLKEKGFDEATRCDYSDKGLRWFNDILVQHNSQGGIACPSLQMAMKWLREVQGLSVYARAVWKDVEIQYGNWEEAVVGYKWFIENLSDNSYLKTNTEGSFRTYEEACEDAIKYCLENLILEDMKRNCTNCAFCERFKYSSKDKTEMMRCWQEPGVCDHAFAQSMTAAEDYVCEEHRTKEEREKELFEEAKEAYTHFKKRIKILEEKYPSLKKLI